MLAKSSKSISFTKFYWQKPKLQQNISTLSKSSVSRRDKHFHTCFDIFSNFCQKCLNKSCVILQILVEYHLFTLYTRKLCEKLMIYSDFKKFENFKKFSFNFNFCKIFPYNLSCFQHILIDFSEILLIHKFYKIFTAKIKVSTKFNNFIKIQGFKAK